MPSYSKRRSGYGYSKKRRTRSSASGVYKKTKTKRYELKDYIRKEAAKVVREGIGQASQKLTLRAQFDSFPVFSEGAAASRNYWRVPITAAIPPRRGKNEEPDDRHREKNKVFIKGVSARCMVDFATTIGVLGVCYEDRVQTLPIGLLKAPGSAFHSLSPLNFPHRFPIVLTNAAIEQRPIRRVQIKTQSAVLHNRERAIPMQHVDISQG
jgi:hypothetical protein